MATMLWHKDWPNGFIFEDDREAEKKLKEGWVDSPDKLFEVKDERTATGKRSSKKAKTTSEQ